MGVRGAVRCAAGGRWTRSGGERRSAAWGLADRAAKESEARREEKRFGEQALLNARAW